MIKVNDLVKIKDEFLNCENEKGVEFKVVEVNGNRLFIVPVICDLAIVPKELVRLHQIELV